VRVVAGLLCVRVHRGLAIVAVATILDPAGVRIADQPYGRVHPDPVAVHVFVVGGLAGGVLVEVIGETVAVLIRILIIADLLRIRMYGRVVVVTVSVDSHVSSNILAGVKLIFGIFVPVAVIVVVVEPECVRMAISVGIVAVSIRERPAIALVAGALADVIDTEAVPILVEVHGLLGLRIDVRVLVIGQTVAVFVHVKVVADLLGVRERPGVQVVAVLAVGDIASGLLTGGQRGGLAVAIAITVGVEVPHRRIGHVVDRPVAVVVQAVADFFGIRKHGRVVVVAVVAVGDRIVHGLAGRNRGVAAEPVPVRVVEQALRIPDAGIVIIAVLGTRHPVTVEVHAVDEVLIREEGAAGEQHG